MMIIKNYLITAWRNIYNHKLFSTINILGLAVGLTACMLIALFVRHELSYDKFWNNSENIYRMHQSFLPTGRPPMEFSLAGGPIYHALKKDFPQVEHAAREARRRATFIKGNDYFEEPLSITDPDFLEIFNFEVLEGNIDGVLNDQNTVVLSKSLADKFFPGASPMGQTITINADAFEREFVVRAVIEDMPDNSQLAVGAIVAINEEEWKQQEWMFDHWFSVNSHLYYTVVSGTKINDINSQMPAFIDRNFPAQGNGEQVSSYVILNSQNIGDLHLLGPGNGEYQDMGSMTTVFTFSAVAILILFIASINFMNLSTARASQRAKEVSLRKVMGAGRKDLVAQFIGESIVITCFALFVSIVLVELGLPIYNQTLGSDLSFDYASLDVIYIIALAVGVGILGGIYPALVLSGFRPAEVLKSNQSSENGSSLKLRAILVIFQFAISISLFVSTAVVYGQMLYAKNIELGFNKENLLVIDNLYREAASDKIELLLNEYRRIPNVIMATSSNDAPGIATENNTGLRTPDMPETETLLIGNRMVSYEYFETYEIPLLAGRSYDRDMNDERAKTEDIRAGNGFPSSLIINETAMRKFGFTNPDEAIDKAIYRGIGNDGESLYREYRIIGVVPDVHLDTLKKEIRPEMFELIPENPQFITIRFTGSPLEIVNQAQTIWEREIPSIPFKYDHAVEQLAEQYEKEQGEMTMFATFSALAIMIACLGLYGLASFTAERRTKEIGVRKVMGASIFDIVKLLVWQFSKPVIIANLVAWPVSFYVMSLWLENFVYRMESIFIIAFCALAGVAALLIAWATVAGNSMRVAKANPIKALRYE